LLIVIKGYCNLKLISQGSTENAAVSSNHSKAALIWNLGIFTSTKLILVYKNDGDHPCHKVILKLLQGHYHKCVNLDVGTRKETVAYFTRCYITSEQLVALKSWCDNHTAISTCCQPITEARTFHYPAQKAREQATSCWYVPKLSCIAPCSNNSISTKTLFLKSIYQPFITISFGSATCHYKRKDILIF
jgi:hypothetical protein